MYKEAKDKGLNPCEIGPDWNPLFGWRPLLASGWEYFLAVVNTLNKNGNWEHGQIWIQAETPQDTSAACGAVRLMEATEVRAQKAAKQARLDF